MAPRRYNSEKRSLAQEETRRRILEAALELHARQSGLATTHAEIAKKADVALPTVYKYFPDRNKLAEGCTAHAMEKAPRLGPEIFEGIADTDKRLEALTRSVFRLYSYLSPWLRWGGDRTIPAVNAIHEEGARQVLQMLSIACEPAGKRGRDRAFLSLAQVLLSYSTYENLVDEQELGANKAGQHVSQALVLLLNASDSSRP